MVTASTPAGQLWLAARELITQGTQTVGLMAASTRVAPGALSRTAVTIARPAGVRGLALWPA